MKYDPECPRKRLALQAKVIMTLADAGFDEVSFKGTNERVFARSCHDTDARVLVYTSIEGGETRGRGKDAIRVCAVRPMTDKKERGIVKTMRVNRVGQIDAITERMLGRMRKAYVQARKVCLVDSPSCKKCGAVQFLSKKGNWVCSNFCWEGK